MTEPPSYAPFLIDTNGHSYEEFTMRLEKVTVLNSQSVSAENVGSWKASLNSPIVVKDAANMTHFSAVTVYRVVTVLVNNIHSYTVYIHFFILYRVNSVEYNIYKYALYFVPGENAPDRNRFFNRFL